MRLRTFQFRQNFRFRLYTEPLREGRSPPGPTPARPRMGAGAQTPQMLGPLCIKTPTDVGCLRHWTLQLKLTAAVVHFVSVQYVNTYVKHNSMLNCCGCISWAELTIVYIASLCLTKLIGKHETKRKMKCNVTANVLLMITASKTWRGDLFVKVGIFHPSLQFLPSLFPSSPFLPLPSFSSEGLTP